MHRASQSRQSRKEPLVAWLLFDRLERHHVVDTSLVKKGGSKAALCMWVLSVLCLLSPLVEVELETCLCCVMLLPLCNWRLEVCRAAAAAVESRLPDKKPFESTRTFHVIFCLA